MKYFTKRRKLWHLPRYIYLVFQINAEGVEKCAKDIAKQVIEGKYDLTKIFVKTPVHPQAAGNATKKYLMRYDDET
jgi:hypothetical protein